jgi:hypothetical protein
VGITWLNAAAFAGLALAALPIAIHLLIRRHTRTLLFPSLRFLRETALAAFRKQRIQDAALLACRVAVIAAAVAALAAPLLLTPGRTAGYSARVARAVVAIEPAENAPLTGLADGAFRFASFERAAVADALADAVRWLDTQPPATREIVLAGIWRRGSIAESDLSVVPSPVGLRFVAAEAPATDGPPMVSTLARRNGTVVRIDRFVAVSANSTFVNEIAVVAVPGDRIRVAAPAGDERLAAAALAAALDAGVPWTLDDRRVVLVWPGGEVPDPAGAELIPIEPPAMPAHFASAVVSALDARTPVSRVEPVLIPREQLDAWSREPGPPAIDAPPADEGDRRWLWAIALLLLGVEQWLRARVQARKPGETIDVRAA